MAFLFIISHYLQLGRAHPFVISTVAQRSGEISNKARCLNSAAPACRQAAFGMERYPKLSIISRLLSNLYHLLSILKTLKIRPKLHTTRMYSLAGFAFTALIANVNI